MKRTTSAKIRLLTFLTVSVLMISCHQKAEDKPMVAPQADIATFEKEIEVRLRTYENYLQNGDSIALGKMYMTDAEIIPSTVGRANITKVFAAMIRDSITGSHFETTNLWGNDQLLVEEGKGSWSHANGQVIGRGKYLLVWKKDAGEWKILRDTWFPDKKN